MFIGHFAPAMIAATHRDAPNLPVLFIGAQLVDWAFFGLTLVGIERMRIAPGMSAMNPLDLYHMPYTHSLVGTLAFAAVFGMLISLVTRNRMAALIGFAVVVSHWFLDLLVHVPDLTITGQPPKLGFGLWNHPAIEMPLELALTFGTLWLYAMRTGGMRASIWTLGGILLLCQIVNWFGPQPPELSAELPLTGLLAFGILTLVSAWAGRGGTASPAALQ